MGTIKLFWEILLTEFYLFLYLTTGLRCRTGLDEGPAGAELERLLLLGPEAGAGAWFLTSAIILL